MRKKLDDKSNKEEKAACRRLLEDAVADAKSEVNKNLLKLLGLHKARLEAGFINETEYARHVDDLSHRML
ncbi:hypothetical protein [Puia sp.]|jgi:hypothetical protein|uniref:hypothetical protein n=1 Tax=Puia sp. TaxID=2045100 RepID=UPI002F3E55E1